MPEAAFDFETEFQLLLGRDPYTIVDGKLVDTVQNEVLRYFNSAAQFHMDASLRNRFICAGVPDVSPKLRPIISGKEAEDFYKGISVPYVAMTLEKSTDTALKQLNITRATRRLSDSMRTSNVYRTQAQDFYSLAWQEQFPGAANFKDDQRQNSRDYRVKAEEALASFIDKQCELSDDNAKLIVRGILNKYLAQAQAGKYWAFRALLAYLSNQNLATLDPMSDAHGEITDSANPSRKLMRQCSVLNALDDSGSFATFLQEMVRHRLFSVVLPQQVDLKTNEKEFGVICTELFQGFMKHTQAQSAEFGEVRAAVDFMLQVEGGQRNLDLMYSGLFGSLATTGTSRSLAGWLKNHTAVAELGDFGVIRNGAGKIGVKTANFARLVAQATVISNIVSVMGNGITWSMMTDEERARTVVAGVDLFMLTAPKALSFCVVTIPNNWHSLVAWVNSRSSAGTRLVRSMSMVEVETVQRVAVRARSLSTTVLLRSETVGVQVESGLRKWLTGEMRVSLSATSRQALAAAQAGEQVTLVRKLFGNNLDHFMATRVGMMLAISGLALSIWGITTAKDDKERWINIAMTATAAFEVCSIGIGMLGIGGTIGRIGSFLGPIGMVASVAVVGYLAYDYFRHGETPTLIKQFVETEAKKEGLYMPYEMDIDYLASSGSLNVGVGVTLASAKDKTGYLQLDLEDKACAVRSNPGLTDYDADTVFDLDVDGRGYVTLISRGYSDDADPKAGTSERKRKPTILTVNAEQKVVAGAFASIANDADAGLWQSRMLGAATKNADIAKSGEFSLLNKKTGMYLSVVNGAVALSSEPFGWVVTTGVPMRKRFTYDITEFDATISDISVDEDQAGARPIKWDSKDIPAFLTLTEEGTLRIDEARFKGVDKKQTWQFTVTASNSGGNFSRHVSLKYQDDYDDDA